MYYYVKALKHECSTQIYEYLIQVFAPGVLMHCFDLIAFHSVEFTLEKGTKWNYE